MKIPFADIKRQYKEIKSEIDVAVSSVIESGAFVRGPFVEEFENQYADAYGVKNCISCANGTDAIYIALKSLGIGLCDEVITTSASWISTSEVVTQAGAKVIFCDIDQNTSNIDVDKLEERITDKTKAVIVVHLYGHPCDMDKITSLCQKHNLFLIEDCAQAHFAEFKGKKVGTFGNIGCFSFYPGKNLGAFGDAGCMVTNDETLAKNVKMFANHGSLIKHQHQIEGINSRLDGIQAAVLSVKLKYIDRWTNRRIEIAKMYNKLLADVSEIQLPLLDEDKKSVFHLYVIKTDKRDELKKYLADNGISTGQHYPSALPFLEAYSYLNHKKEDFPVAHKWSETILSLPMFPEMDNVEAVYVCEKIKEFFRN